MKQLAFTQASETSRLRLIEQNDDKVLVVGTGHVFDSEAFYKINPVVMTIGEDTSVAGAIDVVLEQQTELEYDIDNEVSSILLKHLHKELACLQQANVEQASEQG